ncbi:TPA: 4Fe-4S dicluster domain-containing protein [Desulfurococcaceae archaeon]|nr:4Fe-4S dicluster domain-containing protein [Desulfurococcaceae archaeon]
MGREALNPSRRNLIKGLLISSAAIPAITKTAPIAEKVLKELEAKENEEHNDECYGYYYEPWVLESQEKINYYKALNLVEEVNGKYLVKNPLLPDKCQTYTKEYKYDKYELLPPGADENFYSKCVRCGLCYTACTHMNYHTLKLRGLEKGLKYVGTPVVYDVMNYPCELCMRCTEVCPTDALKEVKPSEVKMGVALIDPDLCWAWNSGDCKSCASACPRGSEVFDFHFNEWGVHTRVKGEECNGCGLCVRACPVPGAAIHVLPKEEYEKRIKNFKNTGMTYDEYLELIKKAEETDPFTATIRSSLNADYLLNVRKAKPLESSGLGE